MAMTAAGDKVRAPRKKKPASAATPLDVTVVVQDGSYASTAVGPIEVFHSAGTLWNWLQGEAEQPRFRVRVASIDGKPTSSAYPLRLMPECALSDIKHTDIIILATCGWDLHEHVMRHTSLLRWLRKWHERGAYVASVCTSVAFLAESGLLDGRQATTHWAVADVFRARYPKVLWRPEQFVTEDNRLFCSGGVYASIDVSLYLVEKFCGHQVALQCAKALLVSMPRGRQSGYLVLPLSRPHSDAKIRLVEEHLRTHFDSDASIGSLAKRAGMSERNFIRRFKAATGHLPGAYVQMLRISAAKEMLERDGAPVQTVCSTIGYEDVAFFRGVFKRHTGMTPTEYRSRFAHMDIDRCDLSGR
jgi:transcriptional regulator GlxA family with amidase domain